MAFVVARKDVDAPKGRVWLYWTGSEWSRSPAAAQAFASRAEALPVHASLVKSKDWKPGANPLVVERKG